MIKKMLSRLDPSFANRALQTWLAFSGNTGVVHHGLQRSGTNYLNECLWRCGNPPLNSFDEHRGSPRHKHCRWYKNKKAIPNFLAEQFGNEYRVDHVYEVNSAAGYPPNTVHIVVKKARYSWLASVMNWGIRCSWFQGKDQALAQMTDLIEDYNHYHNFWEGMASQHPERVCILNLEDIYNDFDVLLKAQTGLGLVVRSNDFKGRINEVPMSPKSRQRLVTAEDINAMSEYLENHPP